MKIIVINGSPKKEKSDTMKITKAFLEGMNRHTENDIKIIDAIDRKINYCLGCFTCMHNGGTCVHNDDMTYVLSEITSSDLVIFSFPLYCYGMPASIKVVVDRLLPLTSMRMKKSDEGRYIHETQKDVSHLKFIMISGCGFPNNKRNFEPMIDQFNLLFPKNDAIITIPEAPMFNAPEAIEVTLPRLQSIKEAGYEYAKYGVVSPELLSDITAPMIPEDIYSKILNGEL